MYLNNENSYYAVIFTSVRTTGDNGYNLMATKMVELAKTQEGFLGVDSAREDVGITVSYWQSLETIKKWKEQIDHTLARKLGREKWYSSYTVRICEVIREYSFHT
jgi:heme-degrading monooxygenase HmoA